MLTYLLSSRILVKTALIAALVLPAVASGLTIDDFEEGPFSVSDNVAGVGSVTAEQAGLPAASVLGGVRFVSLTLNSGPVASSFVPVTSGEGFISHSHGGFSATSSTLLVIYDGTPGAGGSLATDLTADGSNRFAITVHGNVDSSSLFVTVNDTLGTIEQKALYGVGTAGVQEVPFSDFTLADLTTVASISLRIGRSDVSGRTGFSVSHFATIPEPATAALLVSGLLGLAAARRKRA